MKSRQLGGKTRSLTEEISSMMIGPPNTGGGGVAERETSLINPQMDTGD